MRIRRYVARSVQEALERVREELGPDALILHTRRRWRWWTPWRRPQVEVVAAWEPDPKAPAGPGRPAAGPRRSAAGSGRLLWQQPVPGAEPARSAPDAEANGRKGWPGPAYYHGTPAETAWFQRLVEQDVDPTLAWNMVAAAAARSRLAPTSFDRALAQQLSVTVPTGSVWDRQADSTTRVVVLVGPTGAGKTTTAAKLAANFALVAGWRVGLVAADTYRVGAIQQLRTYAELIGVSLDVAQDGQELQRILAACDHHLVLVDTAGHPPRQTDRLAQVRELCQALPPGAEVLLVVPALLRQADLAELLRAYRELPITAVCVTKLDETSRRGVLVNAPCWTGRPLRFVTTGQAVPDDIEAADSDTLARWLLADGRPDGRRPRATVKTLGEGGGRP